MFSLLEVEQILSSKCPVRHISNSLALPSDLWDSYKRGQLLGNEGIAGSLMSASVPAGFKDGLSRI